MLVQNPLHHHLDPRPRTLPQRPVDGDALLDLADQLRRDHLQLVIPHRDDRRIIRSQRIIKRDLVIRQAHVLAALCGGVEILGEFDQLFDDLHRADGSVVVGIEGLLELLGKNLALHEVTLGADFEFVLEQLFQQLGGDVLVFEAAHFGEELVAEDAAEGACGATETDNAQRWAQPD